ncbi:MAG: SH3 domain-containing protein [Phycisphaerae bacterium]|nr:SH3 domain-containing protein [Saprospiraceae bacterium]
MSKLLSLAATLLFFQSFALGIGVYNPGDELFVHAGSGLVLRKTPDPKGERILALNHGDAVKVLKTDFKKKSHSVVEFKGFTIKGFWVKVSTAGGKEGYVFDGYLSKLRAPITIVDDANSGYSIAEFYLLGQSEKKGERIDLPKSDTRYERYKQLFKNGSAAETDSGEGGSSQKITFQKGITLEEAYLIGKVLWLKDMKVKSTFSKGKITVTSEDELWQIEVGSSYGVTVLNMQHAD